MFPQAFHRLRCFTKLTKSARCSFRAILPSSVGHHFCKRYSSEVSSGLLHGVRILDLSRILAGPFCTMLLGDLGAEVIKVEQPGRGDDTRVWGPPFMGDQSMYYLSINRNKKSIAVNMKTQGGKKIIQDLATKCDVLMENFKPGKLEKLGLGYEDLKRLSPSLIYCSLTGYGPDGPYADRAGFDLTASAMGGLMHITGPEDGDPCGVGVGITDLCTGLFAKGAILAALYQREKTGMGQRIDCNLLSTQVALLTYQATNYLMAGMEAKRVGTGRHSIVPYQAFKTKDGQFLIIGAANDELFRSVCKIISLPHLIEDDRFLTNADRVLHRPILISMLQDRFSEKTMSDWLSLLEGSGFPYSPVNSMKQVFEDPQVLHNNMILEMEHKKVGPVKVPGPAVTYSSFEDYHHSPPPRLGEHTAEVLADILEMSHDHIEGLEKEGAIKCDSQH